MTTEPTPKENDNIFMSGCNALSPSQKEPNIYFVNAVVNVLLVDAVVNVGVVTNVVKLIIYFFRLMHWKKPIKKY